MSSINPRTYYDEIDNHLEIRNLLKRDSYMRCFKCMYTLFFIEGVPYLTSTLLQEQICIPDHSRAFHILQSFVIVNLLERKKISKRKETLFFIKNKDWWVTFYKREEEDGSKKTD